MIRYSAEQLLLQQADAGSAVSEVIAKRLTESNGLIVSKAERRLWDEGLFSLASDLVDAGRGKVEMLIEYQLPLTSKRADVVLAGVDRRTGAFSYIVVELKQWTSAEVWKEDRSRVLVRSSGDRAHLHPLLQARGYCDYMADFLEALDGNVNSVHAVAYLYNADRDSVYDLHDMLQDSRSKLFTRTTRRAFIGYLRDLFSEAPGSVAAERLLNSAVAPSRSLLKNAATEVRNRQQYTLLDEQRLAYEMVRHAVYSAQRRGDKRVIVVTGGPGSGKSAIALSLLGELSRQGYSVLHATGSRSYTQAMRRYVSSGSAYTKAMFKYFNDFNEAEQNSIDVLICDEAQRLRESSGTRFAPAHLREKRSQVDVLIHASRVPVFFLDEHQILRPGEVGTLDYIKKHAEKSGISMTHVPLDEQFRVGGSHKYEDWVARFLGLSAGPLEPWDGDSFKLAVADSPLGVENYLSDKLVDGYSARITAGFCWPWSEPERNGLGELSLISDVIIGDWSRPWAVKGGRSIGDAPPGDLWAVDPEGFGQVGSIYAVQGFEFDWNGVIIGPDLVYRDGRMVTVRNANKDPALRARSVNDSEADHFIRQAYWVLFTRALLGTVVISADSETQDYLAKIIPRM
ncbi:DNA/RNA helicase domain-containing protein [Spirillospora sp. NPDC029432]|uniref:DNA/RNA helicase domain-containing protein n=1 Tax=Spirillospora sp. NPDC029432 TaxID=3154599 RepID=UPI003453E8EF